jgi:hypothetical protein
MDFRNIELRMPDKNTFSLKVKDKKIVDTWSGDVKNFVYNLYQNNKYIFLKKK